MRRIQRMLLRFWLLSKRLYKKPAFLVILLLIPLLTVGYSAAAQEESGMLTIALAAEDAQDALSADLLREIEQSSELIRFCICQTPEQAKQLVNSGKADSAWIFPKAMAQRVARFVATREEAVVTVYQREDNLTLRLAREKLSAAVFQCCARELYRGYVREAAPELSNLSDGEILCFYDRAYESGTLFQFSDIDAGNADILQQDYLLLPVRGLLAAVLALCALASAMFYLHDVGIGTFAALPVQKLPAAEFVCGMAACGNVGAATLVSVALAGLGVGFFREVCAMLGCCVCAVTFAMLVRRLCGSLRVLGAALPLLLAAMIAVCPVFFTLGAARYLQYLFPPTYYVLAIQNPKYLAALALYSGVCLVLYALAGKLRK